LDNDPGGDVDTPRKRGGEKAKPPGGVGCSHYSGVLGKKKKRKNGPPPPHPQKKNPKERKNTTPLPIRKPKKTHINEG